jgi:hypothetical protein
MLILVLIQAVLAAAVAGEAAAAAGLEAKPEKAVRKTKKQQEAIAAAAIAAAAAAGADADTDTTNSTVAAVTDAVTPTAVVEPSGMTPCIQSTEDISSVALQSRCRICTLLLSAAQVTREQLNTQLADNFTAAVVP